MNSHTAIQADTQEWLSYAMNPVTTLQMTHLTIPFGVSASASASARREGECIYRYTFQQLDEFLSLLTNPQYLPNVHTITCNLDDLFYLEDAIYHRRSIHHCILSESFIGSSFPEDDIQSLCHLFTRTDMSQEMRHRMKPYLTPYMVDDLISLCLSYVGSARSLHMLTLPYHLNLWLSLMIHLVFEKLVDHFQMIDETGSLQLNK